MEYKKVLNNVEVGGVDSFNLQDTFECGQCFRWNKISDGGYEGIAYGKKIRIREKDNKIVFQNVNLKDFTNIWLNYFDFNLDYTYIKQILGKINPNLKKACEYAPGIKILNQDPWETLCSFIISQNNNIPRIKGIIEKLCENFGQEIEEKSFSFPEPSVIAALTEDDLKPIKCGFRAGYIIDAASKVSSGQIILEDIQKMPLPEARETLKQIKGVGSKVAECTLLYGFHRLDAFPIDVWMKRALTIMFPEMMPEDFGMYAGVAQQYIFHYSRMNSDIFKKAQ